jgi:hypothetical protein
MQQLPGDHPPIRRETTHIGIAGKQGAKVARHQGGSFMARLDDSSLPITALYYGQTYAGEYSVDDDMYRTVRVGSPYGSKSAPLLSGGRNRNYPELTARVLLQQIIHEYFSEGKGR